MHSANKLFDGDDPLQLSLGGDPYVILAQQGQHGMDLGERGANVNLRTHRQCMHLEPQVQTWAGLGRHSSGYTCSGEGM